MVDTGPTLCRGYDLVVVDWDGPESGESHCSLPAGHPGRCRTADDWWFTPISYGGDLMADRPIDPTTPVGNRQQQMSQAFAADRPRTEVDPNPSSLGDRPSPILQYFEYDHLPAHLGEALRRFHDLAWWMEQNLTPGPERSAGLRKLLEAQDCAVRSARDWVRPT